MKRFVDDGLNEKRRKFIVIEIDVENCDIINSCKIIKLRVTTTNQCDQTK